MGIKKIFEALQTNEISIVEAKAKLDLLRIQHKKTTKNIVGKNKDIAIIGLAGYFPMAANLEEFWQILQRGQDGVIEVPEERWNVADFYSTDKDALRKTCCKWGGFISDVDKFDPLFFNISPRDAELIDPLDRLFLEVVWQLFEQTGYTRQRIKKEFNKEIGVFVGAMYHQYHALATDPIKKDTISVSSYATMANRISYFFDLVGPSIALDTMCSSAAIAIHMACENIIAGNCKMAIAGAANLSINPAKYLALSSNNMLSSNKELRSFSAGDGFIPAECVAAVLLKPLSSAQEDNDNILAVIKSTATSHKGRSEGFAVPDLNAQIELQKKNFLQANISPDSISYVEASSSGSQYSDAVEFSALSAVHTNKEKSCAIGSVKSNIGHAEAAAGMTQLAKVVLQLMHKKIVPTIKFEPPNSDIDLVNSPFYLVTKNEDWQQPIIEKNGQLVTIPRRAAINSLGAGGTNCHIIVEEYPLHQSQLNTKELRKFPEIFLFSARTLDQLILSIKQMKDCFDAKKDFVLSEAAYTLQVGREEMEFRVAVIANSQSLLIERLKEAESMLKKENNIYVSHKVFVGQKETNVNHKNYDLQMLREKIESNDYQQLAQDWIRGSLIPWREYYSDIKLKVVALPTYPFAKKRYWVSKQHNTNTENGKSLALNIEQEKSINISNYEQVNYIIKEFLFRALELDADENISDDTSFLQLGMDSIVALKLIHLLEQEFFIRLKNRDFFENRTIGEFVTHICNKIRFTTKAISNVKKEDYLLHTHFSPLSEGQIGLWTLYKASPHMTAYNLPICFKVEGEFDEKIFKTAYQNTLREHPLLTAHVEVNNKIPYWVTNQSSDFNIISENASNLNQNELIALIRSYTKQPFNLEEKGLIRAWLFHAANNEKVFLFVVHHIIFDGASIKPFIKDLLINYHALSQGAIYEIKEQQATFEKFVEWEKSVMVSQKGADDLQYWSEKLQGELPVLELPVDFPRAESRTFVGETKSIFLDKSISMAINKFSSQYHVNISAIFMALFKILLWKYTGQKNIIVGTPIIGRSNPEFENLIGFLLNIVPIYTKLTPDISIASFIQEVQLNIMDSLDHGSYPFAALVRELKVQRTSANSPVFQVGFYYQNFLQSFDVEDLKTIQNKQLKIEFIDDVCQEGENELTLEIYNKNNGYSIKLKYNLDIFTEERIERMLRHYLQLIDELVHFPEKEIKKLQMLTHDEKQTFQLWNHTFQSYSLNKSVYELISEIAIKFPDKPAIHCGRQSLTYKQLNEQSSQLANYLISLGVKKGDFIAICVERSLNMVIGILGVMKAGAVYIPLDPNLPANRVVSILEDANVTLIISHSESYKIISQLNNFKNKTIFLDKEWKNILLQPVIESDFLRQQNFQQQLVYVIYTSGSTGIPKGVKISHQALVNLLLSMADIPGFSSSDRFLAVTTYSFDIAMLEMFLPLIQGGQCFISEPGVANVVDRLISEIERVNPTIMQATPATWMMLFQAGWKNPHKIKILCGGDRITEHLQKQFKEQSGEVWNLYGPTETTIWSSIDKLTLNAEVTIGRPIANTQIYVIDEYNNLLPIGVPGELCISGKGVAEGYLNQPELTASKFIDNPFTPKSKLYRTGDLAYWNNDGKIVLLGRLDKQVKILGYRVELNELENYINKHHLIEDNMVVTKEINSAKHLIVYYVCKNKQLEKRNNNSDPLLLRDYLKQYFPEYMIPSLFVELDSVPFTFNGKKDYKLLSNAPINLISNSLPEIDLEIGLVHDVKAVLEEVIGFNIVDIKQGFFELGLNSLNAIFAVEKINNKIKCNINVTTLFKYSNVFELSEHLLTLQKEKNLYKDENVQSIKYEEPKVGKYPDYYTDALAIIGISCQFPCAENHYDFWNNLSQGKECFRFFSEDELIAAGLSEEIIKNPQFVPVTSPFEKKQFFDADFFNISPRDAEFMDPQFRLLLSNAWLAVEDAGYVPNKIPRTSVFMSASNSFYQAYLPNIAPKKNKILSNPSEYISWIMAQGGSIPTMISYKLGFKGPSSFIHTNCSSSMFGLHLARQSLLSRETDFALVGAATVSPSNHYGYIHQTGTNFSADGHVRAFDANASGMVGGEGVAVIMLKRAMDAINDGDNIYGLILISAVNNDGADKAGYFAPSVNGQSEVIEQALLQSSIDPLSINYVEAHGTGTLLGDPIEIAAINQVYKKFTNQKNYCPIGSVKGNIGHLDTGAGLSGLIKVAMSLKTGVIPPSINYHQANPNIDFVNSPFYVVDKLLTWPEDNKTPRAALSSFGIGGTNAHVILEKYIPLTNVINESDYHLNYLVPISAKNINSLKKYIKKMHDFLLQESNEHIKLKDFSYTLQIGRQAMKYRVAFITHSKQHLIEQLYAYWSDQASIQGCISQDLLRSDDLSKGEKLELLGKTWVAGEEVNWHELYKNNRPLKVSVPGYPFAEDFYWPSDIFNEERGKNDAHLLHPLLHKNTSILSQQKFTSCFTGKEFFLADHVIFGKPVLPAVAYLEMAYTAGQLSIPNYSDKSTILSLKNIVWSRPLTLDDKSISVHLTLDLNIDNEVTYKVFTLQNDEISSKVFHSQGAFKLMKKEEPSILDLNIVSERCNEQVFNSQECYDAFKEKGVIYGPSFQGIVSLWRGREGDNTPIVLAKLTIPQAASSIESNYTLHPSLLDSALQASLFLRSEDAQSPSLPYSLGELQVFHPCPETVMAIIKPSKKLTKQQKFSAFDIQLCDENGKLCVYFKEFLITEIPNKISQMTDEKSYQPSEEKNYPIYGNNQFTEHDYQANLNTDIVEEILSSTIKYLQTVLSKTIHMPYERVDVSMSFKEYGIDSVLIAELTNVIEKDFGSLPKTLFFEYQNIKELASYFITEHYDKLLSLFNLKKSLSTLNIRQQEEKFNRENVFLSRGMTSNEKPYEKKSVSKDQDIAIIGLAGRYPKAKNISEFWSNLLNGVDCITEVPQDRWDHSLYYDEDTNRTDKTYAKWGGFLDDVDKFDAMFFNISPRDAEYMDPQERLFMECVYEAIEDAGYTRTNIAHRDEFGLTNNVGVFVGVMYEEYQLYGAQETILGRPMVLSGSPASIANRVSYFGNFHGPSVAVDTMCSSSLTAIHLACQSLLNGDCEVAIAGGVNVSIHPNKYLLLGQAKFAASNGRCESFGRGGDGYVPGEGIGAVLLKPLHEAINDKDHIYAVIKGSSINHGGKANSYTVPNPKAQAATIQRAIERSGINPRTISYLEAHGTGTKLGDPIEIAGLVKAFSNYTSDKMFCAIGSVKSNIGHCEGAAGIAGLTKVLLQMKYRKLVPSIHSTELNPNITFSHTPFVVQRSLTDWEPTTELEGFKEKLPRRAGVSSFGAGGANAHIIIEEYTSSDLLDKVQNEHNEKNYIIVLSAQSQEQLQEVVLRLLKALHSEDYQPYDLESIVYTLQNGREPMDYRFATVVGSLLNLQEKLQSYINNSYDLSNIYLGRIKTNNDSMDIFNDDEDITQTIDTWLKKGKYNKLCQYWVRGGYINWESLYGEYKPHKISLPTYPFQRERFWIPKVDQQLSNTYVNLSNKKHFDNAFYEKLFDDVENNHMLVEDATRQILKKEIIM